jgi:hypothetical protein
VPLRGIIHYVVAGINHNIEECLLEELRYVVAGINHNIEECLLEELRYFVAGINHNIEECNLEELDVMLSQESTTILTSCWSVLSLRYGSGNSRRQPNIKKPRV